MMKQSPSLGGTKRRLADAALAVAVWLIGFAVGLAIWAWALSEIAEGVTKFRW